MALLLTPAILAVAVVLMLQTPWIKGLATSTGAGILGPMIGQEVEISGLRGIVPFRVSLDRFAMADAEGEWLAVEQVRLAWSWRALLRGRIVVDQLDAERVALPRIGAFPESDKEPEPFSLPRIPALPGWIEVKHLEVHRIEVGEPILGEDAVFDLRGVLLQPGRDEPSTLDLALTRLDADTTHASVHISLGRAALAVDITAHDESILPRMLDLDGPAELTIRGDAPPDAWHGTVSAALGDEPLVDGILRLRVAEGIDARARLTLNTSHPLAPEAVTEQVGTRVEAVLEVRVEEDGRLQLAELTATGDGVRVAISGLLDLPGDALDLQIVARHDDLGPLAGLDPKLGPQPLDATLHLEGSPRDLGIGINAQWDNSALAAGTLRLGLEGGLSIRADVRVIPPEVFLPSAEAAALIADGVHIVADIPSISGERIRVATLDVTGIEGFVLHGDADLAFDSRDGRANFVLDVAALEELAFLLGLDVAGALSVKVDATGTGDRMDIVASIDGQGVRFAQYAIESLRLSLTGGLDGWADGDPRMIGAVWEGDATGLALAPYPGERLRMEGRMEAPSLDEFQFERIFLSDGVMELEAAGHFLPATTSGAIELTAQADSFAPYGELMGTDLTGTARLHLRATLDEGGETGSAELDAGLAQLAGLPAPAQGLIGPSLNAQARAVLADGVATLEAFAIDAANLNATGSGSYALEPGTLDARIALDLPYLAAASAVLGPDASGVVRIDAEASGTLEALTADARLRGTNIAASGAHADELSLDISASGLPGAPSGRVTLTAIERGQQLDAEAAFSFVDSLASATGVTLTLGGNRLDAEGSYHLDTGRPEASATISFDDLAAFEPFLGVALGGSIRGDISVTPVNGDASATIALEASEIEAPFGGLSSLTVSGQVDTLMTSPSGSFNASLTALDAGAVRVDQLTAFVEGDARFVSIEVETAGHVAEAAPFDLVLAAEAAPDAGRVSVQTLTGMLEQYAILLENPSTLQYGAEGLQLDPLVLRIGDGRLEARASQTPESIDARVAWSELPLGIVNAFGAPEVSGTIRGGIDLSGPLSEPLLTLSIEVVELRTALALEPDAPPLHAEITARLSSTTLDATAMIAMSEETRIDARSTLPVVFGIEPFAFEIPEDAVLEATILGDLLMRDPISFAGQVDHQFKGTLTLDYRVDGPVDMPAIQGSARMEGGHYENSVTGTVLDEIDLRVDSNGAGLVVAIQATDGSTGTLSMDGTAALNPGEGFPFSVNGTLDDVTLLRRDDATARVAGTLDAEGTISAIAVNGDLLIGPANIVMSIPRGGRIPEVDYVEVRGGIAAMEEDTEAVVGVDTPMEVTLNIQTRFPNRVNIRGPGLESEWGGEIAVTGTAAAPSVRGELRVLRGHLDLLNSRFALTDSLIVLDGSTPPNPYINVRGETRAGEVTAFILITGTLDALNMRLESDPPLPQDEVLSRVLFDRPIEDISPVQALQLARAAAQLSGTLRGESILGAGGGLLPIDRLDFSPDLDGTGEATVGAGAYLGDDIYVEVRQKLQSGSTAVSINVELRRNLSVQGEVGSDGRTGAGVVYKRDY